MHACMSGSLSDARCMEGLEHQKWAPDLNSKRRYSTPKGVAGWEALGPRPSALAAMDAGKGLTVKGIVECEAAGKPWQALNPERGCWVGSPLADKALNPERRHWVGIQKGDVC